MHYLFPQLTFFVLLETHLGKSYRLQCTQVCCRHGDGLTFGSMEIKLCAPRLESVDLFIVRLWKKW